jgi:hypothetical protein
VRKGRSAYRILVGRPEGRRPLEDPGVDGRIILKRIYNKWVERAWTGLIWLRIGTVVDCCECGNGTSGFIKRGEFLD